MLGRSLFVGSQNSQDETQDRCFTCAALADDYQPVLRFHGERNAIKHLFFAKLQRDLAQFHHRRRAKSFRELKRVPFLL